MATTLTLPLAIGPDGGLASHELDSPEDIAQSVGLLVATRPGERAALPDYGLPDPLGSGVDANQLVDVITEWEERANPADVEVIATSLAAQAATIHTTASEETA